MTRYLISFDDGAMTFPEEELPDVAEAAHKVVQEAKQAGVWVFAAGLEHQDPSAVATDGTVTDARTRRPRNTSADSRWSTCPHAKMRWSGLPRSPPPAAAQEVFELLPDPSA